MADNFDKLVLTAVLDLSQMRNSLREMEVQLAKSASQQARESKPLVEIQKEIAAAAKKTQESVQKSVAPWTELRSKLELLKQPFSLIQGSYQTIFDLATTGAARGQAKEGFFGFGGDTALLQQLNTAMQGTLSETKLLQQAQAGLALGLTAREISDSSKAAAILAKELGASKEAMLQMMMTASFSEMVLKKAGLTQKDLENQILQAQVRRGAELTEQEKALLKIQAVTRAIASQPGGLSRDTKQASDHIHQMNTGLDKLKTDLGQGISITLDFSARLLGKTYQTLAGMGEAVTDLFTPGRAAQLKASEEEKAKQEAEARAAIKVKYLRLAQQKITEENARLEKEEASLNPWQRGQAQFEREKRFQVQVSILAEDLEKADEKRAAREKKRLEDQKKAEEERKKLQQQRLEDAKARARQIQQEALQETLGFQSQMRALSRNLDLEIRNNLTASMGQFSSLFSAFNTYLDRLRLLEKTGRVGEQQNVLAMMERAGKRVLEDAQRTAREATENQRLSLQYEGEHLSVMQTRLSIQRLNAEVTREEAHLRRLMQTIASSTSKEMNEATKARLREGVEAAKGLLQQKGLQADLLRIQLRRQEVTARTALAQARLSVEGAQLGNREKLLQLEMQIAEAKGLMGQGFPRQQEALALERQSLEIAQKRLELTREESMLQQGGLQGSALEQQRLKVQLLATEVSGMEQVRGKMLELSQVQKGFNPGKWAAEQAKTGVESLVNSLGNAFEGFYASIFAGEGLDKALGKMVLSVLDAFGNSLLGAGTAALLQCTSGIFTYGATGNPAGIPLGIAMLGAGSALKAGSAGGAAAIASGAKAGSGGASSAPSAPSTPPPSSGASYSTSTTYVVNMADPWFDGYHEERAARILRYLKKYGPRSGVR